MAERPSRLRAADAGRIARSYRATQEALTNAIRHGQAANIAIELREERTRSGSERDAPVVISLTVSDDGTGLKPGAQAGFGLSAMRERVLSAGGSLVIEGLHPRGTSVSIRIPAWPSISAIQP